MGTHMAPICGVQPGSMWVQCGVAHVNKIRLIVEAGADPGFLDRVFKFMKGFYLKIAPDYLIFMLFLIFLEISHENDIILSQRGKGVKRTTRINSVSANVEASNAYKQGNKFKYIC